MCSSVLYILVYCYCYHCSGEIMGGPGGRGLSITVAIIAPSGFSDFVLYDDTDNFTVLRTNTF